MGSSAVVVLDVATTDCLVGSRQLWARGATSVSEVRVPNERVMLYARFDEIVWAQTVARDLQAKDWKAVFVRDSGDPSVHWREQTGPTRIGSLCVCLPGAKVDDVADQTLIEIEPGEAFGTGSHATTRFLLQALDEHMRGGESVLDIGCGSGVLSVAAARLGAAAVTSIDIEPAAIAATKANAIRNNVEGIVSVSDQPAETLTGSYDIILANLLAATQIQLAGVMATRIRPSGWLGLSGLYPPEVPAVLAAFDGIRVVSIDEANGWTAIIGAAPHPPSAAG